MNDPARSIFLSIVVPVLNEAERLPGLFADLGRQQGVSFELILSDGGSTDQTIDLARRLAEASPFPCRIIQGPPGRGRQLNAGAGQAVAPTLLFLHADSSFPEPLALATGLSVLEREIAETGHERIAGHFALRFQRRDRAPSLAYYYYEIKACLGRPGTIHGDQGFLLRKAFFDQVGPFDESLGYLEDDRLAARILEAGRWILLSPLLETSARRFEQEGLYGRQMVNILIVALEAAGRNDFLETLPELYRQQRNAGRLCPATLFARIDRMLHALPPRERRAFWRAAGRLAARNLWQFFLWLDVRRGFRRGIPHEQVRPVWLSRYDRGLRRLAEHPVGCLLAILPAWLWFHWQMLISPCRSRRGKSGYDKMKTSFMENQKKRR